MVTILSLLWRIALLRSGPEDVPSSSALLVVIITGNMIVSLILSLSLGDQGAGVVLTTILINLAAQAAIIYGLLYIVGKPDRLTQTLSAYFGCDLLLNLLIGSGIIVLRIFGFDVITPLALAIVLWSVVVFGFIFHRALEVHMVVGVGLAFILMLVTVSMGQLAVGNS